MAGLIRLRALALACVIERVRSRCGKFASCVELRLKAAENRTVDYGAAGGAVVSHRDSFTTTTVCRLQM